MIDSPSDISTKYVNPSSIPRGTGKVISSDSPENNATNLFNDPTIKVVDVESISSADETNVEEYDLVFYENDPEMLSINQEPIPDNLSHTGMSYLQAPTNLSISSDSFQIESNSSTSGDGTITYSATLTFDDIVGAIEYEYIVNAGQ